MATRQKAEAKEMRGVQEDVPALPFHTLLLNLKM